MGYVESNLMDNETVSHKAKLHWIVYTSSLLWLITFIFCIIVFKDIASADLNTDEEASFIIILTILIIISGFSALTKFITAWIERYSTELAVTSRRVIAKTGLIKRNTIELNHSKVESFSVNQSILGRILNYGTIVINGTGGIKTPIQRVTNPLMFRKKAMEIIDV